MPRGTPPGTVESLWRERYLRRLHQDGYPATSELLRNFNIGFFDELRVRKGRLKHLYYVIYFFQLQPSYGLFHFIYVVTLFLSRLAFSHLP